MKLSAKYLKWVFLMLYILVIITLAYIGLSSADWQGALIVLIVMILCQFVFILGAGTVELCRPIKRRRIAFPVIVAALMMTLLVYFFCLAVGELTKIKLWSGAHLPFLIIFICIWIFWGVLFFFYTWNSEKYEIMRRLTATVFAGSLIELLSSILSYIIVRRRPGCFVGLDSAIGIIGGVSVMLWAFGPGIALLFFRDRYENEHRKLQSK